MMGADRNPGVARDSVLYANEFRIDSMIGDGPDAGRRCVTIRLAGCNLTCEGCEQPSTWGSHMVSRPIRVGMFLDHINLATKTLPIGAVAITGGEPLIQQEGPALQYLIEASVVAGRTVYIETNGTITPEPWFEAIDGSGMIRWRVAPKAFGALASDPRSKRLCTPALRWFVRSPHAEFLFPCANPTEVGVLRQFCANHQVDPGRVWVYPRAREEAEILLIGHALAPTAFRAGFNVSTRPWMIMMGR